MARRGQLLADKMVKVLQVAQYNSDKHVTSEGLAALVADSGLRQFSYFYRRVDGKLVQGFSSAARIRSYVSFLQYAELLDEECRPQLDVRVDDNGWVTDETYWDLADRAKEVLARDNIGVDKIESAAADLLHRDKPVLPTADRLCEVLQSPVDKRHVKWLMALYALHPAALVEWRQAIMLLPRAQMPPDETEGGAYGKPS